VWRLQTELPLGLRFDDKGPEGTAWAGLLPLRLRNCRSAAIGNHPALDPLPGRSPRWQGVTGARRPASSCARSQAPEGRPHHWPTGWGGPTCPGTPAPPPAAIARPAPANWLAEPAPCRKPPARCWPRKLNRLRAGGCWSPSWPFGRSACEARCPKKTVTAGAAPGPSDHLVASRLTGTDFRRPLNCR